MTAAYDYKINQAKRMNKQILESMQGKANWYLIFVPPGKEFDTQKRLARRKIDAYLPLRPKRQKWSRYQKGKGALRFYPLFPRYLFVGMADNPQFYDLMEQRIISSYCNIKGVAQAIKTETMQEFLSFVEGVSEKGLKEIMSRPKHGFIKGDQVRVLGGPFKDFNFKLLNIKGGEDYSGCGEINMFGRQTLIEVPLDELQRVA